MDYDWKYYMDDLRKGKSVIIITEEDRAGARLIMKRLPAEQRERMEKLVRNMLFDYRQQGKERNALIEDTVRQHTAYCGQIAEDEMLKRRHNAIVYRYMMKTALHNRATAGKMGVSKETLAGDIKKAINELVVMLFGVLAMAEVSESWSEAVKSLFENVRLMKCGTQIRQCFIWREWEQEHLQCRKKTEDVLRCIDKAILMYEEYCENYLITDLNAKLCLEVIQGLYLNENAKSVEDIAKENNISISPVYAYLRKAVGRFAELFEYMAMNEPARAEK